MGKDTVYLKKKEKSLAHLQAANDATVLPGTSRLLLVQIIELDRTRERFPKRHLRLAHDNRAIVLPLHSLGIDFQVQLAHTGSDQFLVVLVVDYSERWIFFRESVNDGNRNMISRAQP